MTDQGSRDFWHTGLHDQGDYFYDASNWTVQVYSTSNPASYYNDVELALGDGLVGLNNYVTCEDLDVRYSSSMGFRGDTVHDIAVLNCDASFIGGTLLDYDANGDPVRYGNGIEFYNSCYNCLVEGCSIWDIYDDGVTNQGGIGTQHDITYRNNIIGDCAESSFSFPFWYAPSSESDIYFENNTCIDAGGGWGQQRPNPCGFQCWAEGNQATMDNVYIRNNIFSGSTMAIYLTGPYSSGITLDNNLYYQSSGNVVDWQGTLYDMAHFAGATPGYYQYDTGEDAHSLEAWPNFANPDNRDFHLLYNSPAIDAGHLNIGVNTDYDGTARPQGPLTTSAPTNTRPCLW